MRSLVLAHFLGIAGVFAWLVPPFEAPDEPAHFDYANFVARNRALPNQFDERRRVSGEGHQPPLYYLAASLVVRALDRNAAVEVHVVSNPAHAWNSGVRSDVPYFQHDGQSAFPTVADRRAFYGLRMLSIAMGLGTLLALDRMSHLAVRDPRGRLLALLFAATLPQFLFITASINNDNLANLLAALCAFYFLVALRDDRLRTTRSPGPCLDSAFSPRRQCCSSLPAWV